jgi:hypothetical protein
MSLQKTIRCDLNSLQFDGHRYCTGDCTIDPSAATILARCLLASRSPIVLRVFASSASISFAH